MIVNQSVAFFPYFHEKKSFPPQKPRQTTEIFAIHLQSLSYNSYLQIPAWRY